MSRDRLIGDQEGSSSRMFSQFILFIVVFVVMIAFARWLPCFQALHTVSSTLLQRPASEYGISAYIAHGQYTVLPTKQYKRTTVNGQGTCSGRRPPSIPVSSSIESRRTAKEGDNT